MVANCGQEVQRDHWESDACIGKAMFCWDMIQA